MASLLRILPKTLTKGCQNRDFTSGQKGRAKSKIIKLQSKSKDFTKLVLKNRYKKW